MAILNKVRAEHAALRGRLGHSYRACTPSSLECQEQQMVLETHPSLRADTKSCTRREEPFPTIRLPKDNQPVLYSHPKSVSFRRNRIAAKVGGCEETPFTVKISGRKPPNRKSQRRPVSVCPHNLSAIAKVNLSKTKSQKRRCSKVH
jgi:hypothetical protein